MPADHLSLRETAVESLLTMAQGAALLPRRRAGKKPHTSTLYRWASTGLRGIRLEAVQVDGTMCTSRDALARFVALLSSLRPTQTVDNPPVSAASVAAVDARLDAEGL
jgi:hypothetical protein